MVDIFSDKMQMLIVLELPPVYAVEQVARTTFNARWAQR